MQDLSKKWGNFVTQRIESIQLDDAEYIKAKQIKDNLFNVLKDELTENQKKVLVKLEESIFHMAALQEEKAYKLGFFDAIKISTY